MPKTPKKKVTKPTKPLEGDFVDKKEFDAFREENTKVQNTMLDMMQKLLEPKTADREIVGAGLAAAVPATPKPVASYETQDAGPQDSEIPPQYRGLVHKFFNPEDGFKFLLTYPSINEKGAEVGGYYFTIVVPKELSNATDAYLKLYKVDLRTRALQAAHMVKGIEEWCQRVARNINYKKKN